MRSVLTTESGRFCHALRILIAAMVLPILSSCKDGGPDNCPQCNSHCKLAVWPRLILGLTDASAGQAGVPLAAQLKAGTYTGPMLSAVDAGLSDHCYCLDHLTGVVCTYTYNLGPSQRDVTVDIWRGDAELGSCRVQLPEHNYCGFSATALEITVNKQDQVLCGSPRVLDICSG